MPVARRLTQQGESIPNDSGEVEAVRWLEQAEALLICAGDLSISEPDAGPFRPAPLSAAAPLEMRIPAQGSWTPVSTLWREHIQLDNARFFESDPTLAWAFWGFWCKHYLEEVPNDFYRYLGTWACSRSQGSFCVTDGISGHWDRTFGEESIWETRGSVSHLQRTDGFDKVWRVGETRMSLTTHRIVTGIASGVTGMRDGLNVATSALTSLLENSKSRKIPLATAAAKPEGTAPSKQYPRKSEPAKQVPSDAVRARISQPIRTLDIQLPSSWNLQAGEAVEVRTRDPVENSSKHQWSPWQRAVLGEDGFSVISSRGHPKRAHAVRRPKRQDLLRIEGELPRDPEDSSSLARPNVSMYGDTKFTSCRCDRQERAFYEWLHGLPSDCRLVILEVGLGRAPQDVLQAQRAAYQFPHAKMIRIGSTHATSVNGRCCSIFGKTLEGLQRLMEVLGEAPEMGPEREAVQSPAELETEDPAEQQSAGSRNSTATAEDRAGRGSAQRSSRILETTATSGEDGLVHWDEIEETGETEESDAFAQLAAMASGMFPDQPDDADEADE